MIDLSVPERAIGIITPSGNIVVERVAIALQRSFPAIGLHFTRIPVSGNVSASRNYDGAAMLSAARLLADARPTVLLWAGSMGVLVGLEAEQALRDEIEAATGIPVVTPTLVLRDMIARGRLRRMVLVTPYTDAYQQQLMEGLGRLGLSCEAEVHAGIADNLAYATLPPAQIGAMAREAVGRAPHRPDAILTWCTNLMVPPAIAAIEADSGVPVLDATLLGFKGALSSAGADPASAQGWGQVLGTLGDRMTVA